MNEVQLLERFVSRRDEAAFEAMVARHGPMVLGVCRQVLRDPSDVGDVFHATFLALARKAGSLRRSDLLGNWLYGVALRARSSSTCRRATEAKAGRSEVESSNGESRPWLHDEIGPTTDAQGLASRAHEAGRGPLHRLPDAMIPRPLVSCRVGIPTVRPAHEGHVRPSIRRCPAPRPPPSDRAASGGARSRSASPGRPPR